MKPQLKCTHRAHGIHSSVLWLGSHALPAPAQEPELQHICYHQALNMCGSMHVNAGHIILAIYLLSACSVAVDKGACMEIVW